MYTEKQRGSVCKKRKVKKTGKPKKEKREKKDIQDGRVNTLPASLHEHIKIIINYRTITWRII